MSKEKGHPLKAQHSSCPYDADAQEASLERIGMPQPSAEPLPGQTEPLPTDRESSTIPMGGKHAGNVWVYPSQQMFYNAMRRKDWDPAERDMQTVVPIHNAVNEEAWRLIMQWEHTLHQESWSHCGGTTLLKFRGRPKDLSPKAFLWSLLGFSRPFDRHDWTIDRCGETVEYVIDFYGGHSAGDGPASFYLDVRPKVSPQGLYDRLRMAWKTLF